MLPGKVNLFGRLRITALGLGRRGVFDLPRSRIIKVNGKIYEFGLVSNTILMELNVKLF